MIWNSNRDVRQVSHHRPSADATKKAVYTASGDGTIGEVFGATQCFPLTNVVALTLRLQHVRSRFRFYPVRDHLRWEPP